MSLVCYVATNKQTKTFPWREGGKEGGEAWKEGEGEKPGNIGVGGGGVGGGAKRVCVPCHNTILGC